jgi:hypothetical protein
MAKKARPTTISTSSKQAINTATTHKPELIDDTVALSQSRALLHSSVTWKEAVADFLMQVRATREENTEHFYFERLRLLPRRAETQSIPQRELEARNLREYLAHRAGQGVSDQTRRHDAVSARVILKFYKREDYVDGDRLAGYQVPKAGRICVKYPSDDEIRTLLIPRTILDTSDGCRPMRSAASDCVIPRASMRCSILIETIAFACARAGVGTPISEKMFWGIAISGVISSRVTGTAS